MGKFQCDREGEELDWFLYREKVIPDREEAGKQIEAGNVTINGKVVKKKNYKPKKGDKFELTTPGRHMWFTVAL